MAIPGERTCASGVPGFRRSVRRKSRRNSNRAARFLPQDDTYLFSVERADPRRVLFLYAGGRNREGFFYKAAMESSASAGLLVDKRRF